LESDIDPARKTDVLGMAETRDDDAAADEVEKEEVMDPGWLLEVCDQTQE
jgi:hypothetical protein